MSLLGPNKPKGITPEELIFIKGELRNGEHKLTENQANQLLARLSGYMDSDTINHPEWKNISDTEVRELNQEVEHDALLHLTPEQKDKIEAILSKYVSIDKHKSLF